MCAFLEHAVTHRYSILVQIPESQASMLFKQNPWQQEERKNSKGLIFLKIDRGYKLRGESSKLDNVQKVRLRRKNLRLRQQNDRVIFLGLNGVTPVSFLVLSASILISFLT